MQRLKRAEDKKKQEARELTSSSSSSWHWHSSWWESDFEHSPQNGMTADSTGEPVFWWLNIYLREESQRAEDFGICIVKIGYS